MKTIDTSPNVIDIEEKKNNIVPKEIVTFRVQIETSDKKLSLTDQKFKGLKMFEYQQDKVYKYTTGEFENDFDAANKYKKELAKKGFGNAFVVAFLNGERINIEKGIKLAKK